MLNHRTLYDDTVVMCLVYKGDVVQVNMTM